MQFSDKILIALDENPAILGTLSDANAGRLGIMTFAKFEHIRLHHPVAPQRPIPAIYHGENEAKRLVFRVVNEEKELLHHQLIVKYEKEKYQADILKPYASDLAGYGKYLIDRHPHVMAFFSERRPFEVNERSRRLHTYITGGTGSGKSELMKSLVYHYLTTDTSTALVFIDPHNDISKQVAAFAPNATNDRLAYIEPRINDRDFPGLNPFDIDGKESLTDIQAETYADEFVWAFQEILEGSLTDQMVTLLKNTIPVLMKMPDASVYDLIAFLRPKTKEQKGSKSANVDEPAVRKPDDYAALRYVEFAKANFENVAMLEFLTGQFEDDAGYTITRNGLTTRLVGIFGNTLMQSLFRGPRTVRFEDLIPNRKLVVFNLAGLGLAGETIGKFIVTTLKIFALNQSKVPQNKRVACHVFIDECQKFVTESIAEILQEARKFQVFLTLAQQSAGAKMSPSIFEAVLTNAATKIAGVNSGPSLATMAKEIGIPAETMAQFKTGQFAIFQREGDPKQAIVRMPANTVRNRAAMPAADWDELLKTQLRKYYRGPDQQLREPEKEEPAQARKLADLIQVDISALLT